jgi:hypothetical protein
VLVALAVLLLAEGAVRVGRAHLAAPDAWPSPELQKKYDQIVARAASHQPTDVVLVGDSMMDAAGDPAELAAAGGPSAIYNASIAGETLPTIADWTTKVVVPRLHPKLVVVGFSSNELNPAVLLPGAGYAAYRRSRAAQAARGTGDLVDRADAFLRQWSYLYRYRDSLRFPLGRGNPGATFDPALTVNGHDLAFVNQGYLAGSLAHAKTIVIGVLAALRGFKVGPDNVAILQNMLAALHRQGVAVLLVAMPVTADLVSLHPGGAPTYNGAIATLGTIAQGSGAGFAEPGVWPISDFADPVHLNGVGTARFSAYLAPRLTATGAGQAAGGSQAP